MKKIIIFLFIFMIIMVCLNEKENILIPDNAIRFRIVANSNTDFDQNLKLDIKEDVEKVIYNLIKDVKNIEEARNIITDNIVTIDNILKAYNIKYDINFGNNYFPVKEYKGVTYNEGIYESLVITIGEGLGNNWWCVLFPPLCLLDEQANLDDVEYEMYATKLINKFK